MVDGGLNLFTAQGMSPFAGLTTSNVKDVIRVRGLLIHGSRDFSPVQGELIIWKFLYAGLKSLLQGKDAK